MSALAQTFASRAGSDTPVRSLTVVEGGAGRDPEPLAPGYQALLELATADDLASGTAAVVEVILRATGATRVEWWAPGTTGELELVAEAGGDRVRRRVVALRGAVFLVFGGRLDPQLESSLAPLVSIFRRRRAEEQLARLTTQLARRNGALEDYASLVAHELKNPLQAALLAGTRSGALEQALTLVEDLLEAARTEGSGTASAAESLEEAVRELGATEVEITAELSATLPLPPTPLRVILRNLLANAVAAGAGRIHVTAVQSSGSWGLHVDDDGPGLGSGDYAAGSGVGLTLCKRIAGRFGGALELAPGSSGGTRATLAFDRACT